MKPVFKYILFSFLFMSIAGPGQSQHWAETNGWSFDNFTQPEFDWTLFRETFIGVAPTQATSANFDNIFYEEVYKTLPSDGHCYGIDLLALMMLKHGGYLGYCHPPHVYAGSPASGPTDPQLLRAMQLMHGQQLTHRFLLHVLDIVAINKNRDGRYAYDQFVFYEAKDDPCIVSVTEGLNPDDGGHAVIAYDVADLGATKRIYIWDPNRSYYESAAEKAYYDSGSNFIEINSGSGEWSFLMSGEATPWTGHPGGGGNIITIPLSIAGKRDRLPQSLFADVAEALTKIFVYAEDAELEQVTDDQGRRMFLPGTHEFDTSMTTGMRNVMPFIPLAGSNSQRKGPKVYFYRGNEPIEITIQSKSNGYRLDVLGKHGYVSLTSHNGQGEERLSIAGIHSVTPELSFQSESTASSHQLDIYTLTEGDVPMRVFKMEDLKVETGNKVDVRIAQAGDVLEVQSKTSELSYNLKLENSLQSQDAAVSQEINMKAGERLQLRAQNWTDPLKRRIEINRE